MIIDFRARPPFKSFLNMRQFGNVSPQREMAKESFLTIGRELNPSAQNKSLDLFLEEMASAGIGKAVLMPRVNDKIEAKPVSNDDAHELAGLYPDLFIPFAGIDPSRSDALNEVKRNADRGFKGISMDPGFLAMHADAPCLDPVYAFCEERGLIASIASSGLIGPDMSYCEPLSINRVSVRFPKLKIVVPHACWPNTDKALCLPALNGNIYLMPDTYVYTRMPMWQTIVEAANGYMQRNILFASSYPLQSLKQTTEVWRSLPFTKETLWHSLYYNAAKLLGL